MDHVDIFLSYAREDAEHAERLVRALEAQGWRVFWDRTIPAGETFVSHIQSHLDAAAAVIVAWSRHSVESEFVYSEASRARARKTLVPILIEPVTPPLGLDVVHAADLVGWIRDGGTAALPDTVLGPLRRLLPQQATSPPPDTQVPPRRLEPAASTRARPPRKSMTFTMVTAVTVLAALVVTFVAIGPSILPITVASGNPEDRPIGSPPRPGPVPTPAPRRTVMPTSSGLDEPSWLQHAQWCETSTQPPTASQSARIMPGGGLRGTKTPRDLFQQAAAAAARNDCAMATAWMVECQSDNAEAAASLRNTDQLCRWLATH